MERLVLIHPALEHKMAAEEFKQEFIDHGEKVIKGSTLLDQLGYDAWLEHTTKNSNSETVQKGWVVADTCFAALLAERWQACWDDRHPPRSFGQ